MTERKSFSKETILEVYKRDLFTCQECGGRIPDVILFIINKENIQGDEISNLTTTCNICNRNFLNNKYTNSIVKRQRLQIEELNLRRVQLEMYLEYRNELSVIQNFEHLKAINYINSLFNKVKLSKLGEENLAKLVDKFGLINVLDAIDISKNKYSKRGSELEILELITSKIGGILYLKDKPEHIQKIAYIKGICKNKFGNFDSTEFNTLILKCYELGGNLDKLQNLILEDYFKSYRELLNEFELFINSKTQKND